MPLGSSAAARPFARLVATRAVRTTMPVASLGLLVLLVSLLLLVGAAPACAWRSTGHMIVAQIAYDELSTEARAEADRLSALYGDMEPSLTTFVDAATWLDGVRESDVTLFNHWHYVNLPYNADGLETLGDGGSGRLLFAIEHALDTLESPDVDDRWRSFALRVLTHLVADAHQPLHCVQRFSLEHPSGDRGGNDFEIHAADADNLHWLWDSTFGLFPEVALDRVGEPEVATDVSLWARRVVAAVPPEPVPTLEPAAWARESFALAGEAVYAGIDPGDVPSDAYLDRARGVVLARLRLAGQRLAAVLEPLLASSAHSIEVTSSAESASESDASTPSAVARSSVSTMRR